MQTDEVSILTEGGERVASVVLDVLGMAAVVLLAVAVLVVGAGVAYALCRPEEAGWKSTCPGRRWCSQRNLSKRLGVKLPSFFVQECSAQYLFSPSRYIQKMEIEFWEPLGDELWNELRRKVKEDGRWRVENGGEKLCCSIQGNMRGNYWLFEIEDGSGKACVTHVHLDTDFELE